MTIRDATACDEFFKVARTVRRVCELPAVPTLDWCERAALALTSLVDRSVVRVWMVSATERGRVIDAEDAGAADGRAEGGGSPAAIRGAAENERNWLGWWIAPTGNALRSRASVFRGIEDATRDGAEFARWWQDRRVLPRVVGLAPIPPESHGRHLAVEIGCDHGTASDDDRRAEALEAVLHELARRALVAFGAEPIGPANRITDRELEVLDLLALGHSVREIADALERSPHTVHDHVKSLHRKLRVSSRGELIGRMLGRSAHVPMAHTARG